jgi:hypothetical protein
MSQGTLTFSTFLTLNPGLSVPYIILTDGSNALTLTPTTQINIAGPTGAAGFTGLQGDQGPRGYAGPQGAPGSATLTGATGALGPTGYTGCTGHQGTPGSADNTGATGPSGPSGPTGVTGPQGADGAATNTGARGPTGPVAKPSLGTGNTVLYDPASSNLYYNSSFSVNEANIQVEKPLYINQSVQRFSTITEVPSDSVTLDWSQNSVWTLSSLSTNFTANIVNVPAVNNQSYVVLLNILQADYPYFTSTIQVNNTTVPLKWAGGIVPTPAANAVELESISLFYLNGWISLAQYASFQ